MVYSSWKQFRLTQVSSYHIIWFHRKFEQIKYETHRATLFFSFPVSTRSYTSMGRINVTRQSSRLLFYRPVKFRRQKHIKVIKKKWVTWSARVTITIVFQHQVKEHQNENKYSLRSKINETLVLLGRFKINKMLLYLVFTSLYLSPHHMGSSFSFYLSPLLNPCVKVLHFI